jgi:hypothetical protein
MGKVYTIDYAVLDEDMTSGVALGFSEMASTDCYELTNFQPVITKTQEEDIALFAPLLERKRKSREAAKS